MKPREGSKLEVLAIDPGPQRSAFCLWDGATVAKHDQADNAVLRWMLTHDFPALTQRPVVVLERVACYGMPVGADVFDTCYESGRMIECAERAGLLWHSLPRLDVKRHVCHDTRAKDANITAALVDRFGNRAAHGKLAKGTKNNPGFFYGFASHDWAAFALAVTAWDLRPWVRDSAIANIMTEEAREDEIKAAMQMLDTQ